MYGADTIGKTQQLPPLFHCLLHESPFLMLCCPTIFAVYLLARESPHTHSKCFAALQYSQYTSLHESLRMPLPNALLPYNIRSIPPCTRVSAYPFQMLCCPTIFAVYLFARESPHTPSKCFAALQYSQYTFLHESLRIPLS